MSEKLSKLSLWILLTYLNGSSAYIASFGSIHGATCVNSVVFSNRLSWDWVRIEFQKPPEQIQNYACLVIIHHKLTFREGEIVDLKLWEDIKFIVFYSLWL